MALFCFSDVLAKAGIDPARVKLIRYTPKNEGFSACRRQNMVAEYAARQVPGFGDGYDWFALFLPEPGTGARFFGLYRLNGWVPDGPDAMPAGFPFPEWFNGQNAFYHLIPSDKLAEYEQRLVINWGGATALWHQSAINQKPITALTAAEPFPFPGYEGLVLSFDRLTQLAQGEPVFESWATALSETKAVYLVTDTGSGRQYVGCTCGEHTLMGRLRFFVVTHHGGVEKIRRLLAEQPEQYRAFQFSILQALPLSATDKTLQALQSLYIQKLCSRQWGFND